MSETCPNHGKVRSDYAFTQSDDGEIHLGARCPALTLSGREVCGLWLRWASWSGTTGQGDVPLFPAGLAVEMA